METGEKEGRSRKEYSKEGPRGSMLRGNDFSSQLPKHSPWETALGVKHGGGTRPWKPFGGERGGRGDMIKERCLDPSFSEGRVRRPGAHHSGRVHRYGVGGEKLGWLE